MPAPPRVSYASRSVIRSTNLQFIHSTSGAQTLAPKDRPSSTKGLEPKILNEDPVPPEKQSEDVKRHNRELEEMAGRATEGIRTEDAHKDKESPMENAKKGMLKL